MATSSEVWKDVAGFEGLYMISNQGQVKSLGRILCDGKKWVGRILKPTPNGKGYLQVVLMREGKRFTRYVHILVAQTFLGKRPDGFVVCHGKAGQRDNSVDNLEYGTESENHLHQYRDGTMSLAKSIKSSRGEVFRSIREAARITNIPHSSIGTVLSGKMRTAGGRTWEYVS